MALNSTNEEHTWLLWGFGFSMFQFVISQYSLTINNIITRLIQGHFARQGIRWGNNAWPTLIDAYSWYFRGPIEFPKLADIGDFWGHRRLLCFTCLSLQSQCWGKWFGVQSGGTHGPVIDLLELCIGQTAACWRLQYSQTELLSTSMICTSIDWGVVRILYYRYNVLMCFTLYCLLVGHQ